jgi:outer membrane protein
MKGKPTMVNKKVSLLLILAFCFTGSVQKCIADEQADSNVTFLLGPGVVITDKPYKGVDSSVFPIPLIKLIAGRFYISGTTAGYRLLADDGWNFDVIGKWRFDGYDADDSGRLDGMHNRNHTSDIGGEFTLTGDWGEAWISAVTDAFSQHDGQEIKLGYTKPFVFNKLTISPAGGLIWQSNNLANYYYGVRADEARPGRPTSHIGDSTNWFVGLKAEYQASERWTYLAGVTYQFLDSKIRKSPIVDDSFTLSVLAGAMYKF